MFWQKKPQPPAKIAASEATGAPERGTEDADSLLQIAQQQLQFGLYQLALASFEQVLGLDGTSLAAWEGKGAALKQLKRFEEANQAVETALQLKSNSLPLDHNYWFNRGYQQQVNLAQFEDAITSYDQALQLKPDFHEVWFNRGVVFCDHLKKYEDAIASYDQALQLKPDDHLTWQGRGSALFHLGQHETAIASFDQALQLKPDYHEAWHGRGFALSHLGQYEDAIAAYDAALQIKPDDHRVWHNRGNALINLGQFEVAIASVDKALQLKPDFHEAWQSRGFALFQLGQSEVAIAAYDQALQIKPDYHEAWLSRGNALTNLGQFEVAIASFDLALQIKPDYYEVWQSRGFALFQLGQYEAVIASFDVALQIKPDSHEAWLSRGVALEKLGQFEDSIAAFDLALQIKPDYYEAWCVRGLALFKLGQFEAAFASYDQALQLKPDSHEAWCGRGSALINLGQFEAAFASYNQALQLKPDYHEAWCGRGSALFHLEQYEDAIASYDQALQLKPNHHEAWQGRGLTLSHLGQHEAAITSYDQALQIKPDDHLTWQGRGFALFHLGQHETAIAAYDVALQLKPDYHEAWHNLGFVFANLGQYEAAIAAYDQALQIKPDKHEAWCNRGVALSHLEQYEAAIAAFDQALQLKPDDHLDWNGRGVALFQLEQYEAAIAAFDQALRLKPDDHLAWDNRAMAAIQSGGYDINAASVSRFQQMFAAHRRHLLTSFATPTVALQQFQAQPLSPALLATLHKVAAHTATLPEPLKTRGWEGCLASHHAGLTHCPPTTHPLGHGFLQTRLGNAYYNRARLEANPRPLWHQATQAYDTALQVLTDHPTEYLEALQNLIRPLLALGEVDRARILRSQAVARFNDLINNAPTTAQKRRLETQFSRLAHIQIDSLIADHEITLALETADRTKNRTLTWILDDWQAQVHSPTYADVQRHLLTDPHTAALYWHLSDDALTTFILLPHQPEPIVLERNYTILRQQHQRFSDWFQQWNRDYDDYRGKKRSAEDQKQHPWRVQLVPRLTALKEILQIDAIAPHLTDIHHLILLPHRDLHRLPLHSLFVSDGSCLITSHLPSLQLGLALQTRSPRPTAPSLLSIADPDRPDTKPLSYARLESAILESLFAPNVTAIAPESAHLPTVTTALPIHLGCCHFTGHGHYDAHTPEHSALGLTGSDQLTAKALAALPLHRLSLVSLSACETASSGRQTHDIEYVGLTSALLKAGVPQVISTLWPVEEVSNAYLMIRFYQAYLAGNSPAIALQTAQNWLRSLTYTALADWLETLPRPTNSDVDEQFQSLIRRTRQSGTIAVTEAYPYADPYYWAAFTFTGRFASYG